MADWEARAASAAPLFAAPAPPPPPPPPPPAPAADDADDAYFLDDDVALGGASASASSSSADGEEARTLLLQWEAALSALAASRPAGGAGGSTVASSAAGSAAAAAAMQAASDEALPLLAVDVGAFLAGLAPAPGSGAAATAAAAPPAAAELVALLWGTLTGLREAVGAREADERRATLPGRGVSGADDGGGGGGGGGSAFPLPQAGVSPLAVLLAWGVDASASGKPSAALVELQGEAVQRAVSAASWCGGSEALLGVGMAFHTTGETAEVDVRAWARAAASRRAARSAAEPAARLSPQPHGLLLALLPYPTAFSGRSVAATWALLGSSDSGMVCGRRAAEGDPAALRRAAAVDVVRGLIEGAHRDIGFKAALWDAARTVARSAAAAADSAAEAAVGSFARVWEDSDADAEAAARRQWQERPAEAVAAHPLVRILVPLLDRAPLDEEADLAADGEADADGGDSPREAAAARVLHAAALLIAGGGAPLGPGELAATPVARWCRDAAPVAADVLDLWCGAFDGLALAPVEPEAPRSLIAAAAMPAAAVVPASAAVMAAPVAPRVEAAEAIGPSIEDIRSGSVMVSARLDVLMGADEEETGVDGADEGAFGVGVDEDDDEGGGGDEGSDGDEVDAAEAPAAERAKAALSALGEAAARAMGGAGVGGDLLDRILGLDMSASAGRASAAAAAADGTDEAAPHDSEEVHVEERVTFTRNRAPPSSGFGRAAAAAGRRR